MFDKLRHLIFLLSVVLLAGCSLAVQPGVYPDREVYAPVTRPVGLVSSIDYESGNLVLEWEEVSSASYYTVHFQTLLERNDEGSASMHRQITNDSSLSISLDRLEKNQIYFFSVSAANSKSGESSANSDEIVLSTLQDFSFSVSSTTTFAFAINIADTIYNNTRLVEPSFTVELFADESMETFASDIYGNEIRPYELAVAMSYDTGRSLQSNTTYFYRVTMYIDGYAVCTQTASFSTAISYIAPAVTGLSVRDNLASAIELDFTLPVVNPGLEDTVERRVQITRNGSDGSRVVVLVADDNSALEATSNEDGTLSCTFRDGNALVSGIQYSYTVTSYYHFTETQLMQEGQSHQPTDFVHCLSTPDLRSADLAAVDDSRLAYRASFTVYLPFGLSGDAAFRVQYVDNADPYGEIHELEIETSAIGNSNYSITGTIELSESEAESTHYYVFSISQYIGREVSDAVSSDMLETTPTKENVADFFTDFTVSQDEGEGVLLSWSENTVDGFEPESITWELYRSETSAALNEENRVADFSPKEGSWTDTSAEAGKNYFYTLRAIYTNAESTSNGVFTLASGQGRRLGTVTDLAATVGEYADSIVLTWSPVENAGGFNIYMDGGKEPVDSATNPDMETGLFSYTYTEVEGYEGMVRSFQVVPYDMGNDEGLPSNTAKGNALGPYGLAASATVNSYADRIVLTWQEIPGASQYSVCILYDDEETGEKVELYSERIEAGLGQFIFDTGNANLESVASYPLSMSYSFTITPWRYEKSGKASDIVTGSWIQPPRSISASKGIYRDMTVVSWEPVDGASSYRLYRRSGDYGEWSSTIFSVEGSATSASIIYEEGEEAVDWQYTVATVMNGVTGPRQEHFEEDANIGVPLYDPQNIIIQQMDYSSSTSHSIENDLLTVSFDVNPYATSYVIDSHLYSNPYIFNVTADGGIQGTSSNPDAEGYAAIVDGKVTVKVKRPVMAYSSYITLSISSRNSNATSFGVDERRIPNWIYPVEVVNISNIAIRQILTEINSAWGGDWWPDLSTSAITYKNAYGYFTADSCYGASLTNALVNIISYSNGGISLTGAFGVYPDYGYAGWAGNLNTDPLQALTNGPKGENLVNVELPYGLGKATIVYNSVDIKDSSGTYTVSIDRNGDGTYEETATVAFREAEVVPFS